MLIYKHNSKYDADKSMFVIAPPIPRRRVSDFGMTVKGAASGWVLFVLIAASVFGGRALMFQIDTPKIPKDSGHHASHANDAVIH